MDKELKNMLSEMKRLMNYNRSSSSYINEQGFGGAAGIVGTPENFKQETGFKDAKTGIWYKQKFVKPNGSGYFNNDMKLGECFTVNYFDGSSNALNSMDFPNIIKDPNPNLGYFIYGDVLNSNNKSEKIRIYLPKDEFFKNLNGVIKSFIAYKTCNDQQKKQDGIKYSLIYQLNNPEKAIINQVITADGIKYIDDDPSRGWSISFLNGSQTGYFANTTKELLPNQLKEFALDGYSEEFGRSEFDIWYDSGWGTAIQIGGAIIIGMISGGIGTALTAGMESLIAARAITLGIEVGAEILYAIPEAIYLKKRGMNSASTIVLLFSLLPLFNRLGYVRRLAGEMTQEEMNRFVLDLSQKAKDGKFNTPADVQKWLNGLDANTRAWAERMIREGSAAMEKVNTKEVQEQLQNGLKKLINETKVQNVVKGAAKNIYDKEFSALIKQINPTTISGLKLAGIDVVATFGSMPAVMAVVKDNEEFIKDPQKILQNASETITKIGQKIVKDKFDILVNQTAEVQSKLVSNPDDMDSSRKYVDLVYELNSFSEKTSISEIKSQILVTFLQKILIDLKNELVQAQEKQMATQEALKVVSQLGALPEGIQNEFWEKEMSSHCSQVPYTDFTTLDEACQFIDWVNSTKTDFNYTSPSGRPRNKITDCKQQKGDGTPDIYVMKWECGIRTAYTMYKAEYEKTKTNELQQKRNYLGGNQ